MAMEWTSPTGVLVLATGGVVVLAALQVTLASIVTLRSAGSEWVLGPRDQPFDVPGAGGRLVRAHRNLLEVLPQYVACVLCVFVVDSVSAIGAVGGCTFLLARVLYVPAYLSAIPWLRPICWQFAFIGMLAVLVDVFIG